MTKSLNEIDKTFGKVCRVCKTRHVTIATIGNNLPKSAYKNCGAKA